MNQSILIVRKTREEKEHTICQREKDSKHEGKRERKWLWYTSDAYHLLQWNGRIKKERREREKCVKERDEESFFWKILLKIK